MSVQGSGKDDEISVDVQARRDKEQTIGALLNKLERLDEEIYKNLEENDELKREISSESTELTINKHILVNKTESYDTFEAKYNDILKKHSACYKK